MPVLKRALFYLRGKLSRSIMLFIFMFFLMLSYMLALFYCSSSDEYRKIMVSRYPPEIMLYALAKNESDAKPLPAELIQNAEKTPHITGYNTTFVSQAKPDNFINAVTFKEENGFSALPPSDMVEVQADLFTQNNPLFIKGQAVLINGNYPDDTHSGLLIENTLADRNHLKLGDHIISSISQGNSSQDVDLPVVGIYKLESPVEVMKGTEVYVSQNSVLFAPYSALQSLSGLQIKLSSLKLYLDSYDSADQTLAKLKSLNYDHQSFTFGKTTPIMVGQLVKSMDMVDRIVSTAILIFVFVSATVFILLLILSLRNFYYEAAVLNALGESKKNVSRQFSLQILLVAIIAALLSALGALITAPYISRIWLGQVTKPYTEGSLLSIFDEQRQTLMSAFNLNFVSIDIGIAILTVFCLVLIFLLITRFLLKKRSSRELFSNNDL